MTDLWERPAAELERILLVGVFHFVSRRDAVRPEAFDVSTPGRQREIAEVVERLARYRPTKVVLELDGDHAGTVDRRYRAYREGTYELAMGEAEQIGFRVADARGHQSVYPANDWGPDVAADPETVAYASASTEHAWARFQELLERSTYRQNRRQRLPIPDHLAELTAEQSRTEGLTPYLSIVARLVHGDDRAGADMVGAWYHRNARIYANILELVEPGDRVLVLFGFGHIPVLRHFFEAAGEYALDDPIPYLTSQNT